MGWFSKKAKRALETYYKKTPEDAEQAKKEMAAKEERERLRFDLEKLLDKYDMNDLNNFCSKYLGEAPASREILRDGTERELKPNRHTFVNFILEYYDKGQLRAEQIKDFSLKHRIVTPSFFANETESIVGNENELNDILNVIDEKVLQIMQDIHRDIFVPEKFKDFEPEIKKYVEEAEKYNSEVGNMEEFLRKETGHLMKAIEKYIIAAQKRGV